MTPPQASTQTSTRPEPCYRSRLHTAQAVDAFADPYERPISQRQYAQEHGIPRSTLGCWLRQEYPEHLDASARPSAGCCNACPISLVPLQNGR